jgi:hypothetical protein
MIHFITTARHTYPVADYLKSWAGPAQAMIRILSYETLPTILPRGTYIFSDLERLSADQAVLAGEVWRQLAASGPAIRLLNHPLSAARRMTLLERMYAAGRNRFRAYRATDGALTPAFPVFVRTEHEHEGSFSGLLRDHSELDQAIVRLLLSGAEADDILIVEFCDTSRDGLYRKYSAFRVGDRIVPRHLIFSRKWLLKIPDLLDESMLEEERAYLDSNPHEQELKEIFDAAEIQYGRIDYGLLDGNIQVWEINTNPVVMLPRDQYKRQHLPTQEVFAARIRDAFTAIDAGGMGQPMVPITLLDAARRIRGIS